MENAPWSIRRKTNVTVKFEWAPGVTKEQQEETVTQLKGVINRMGAKSRLRDWIVERFPPHHTYVEPFGGSFKILLWKKRRSKVEIINDIDMDIVNFFRYLTFFPEELADLINTMPTHEGLVLALRDELKKGELNGLERAAAFYYQNQLSFNGTGTGYAGNVLFTASAKANRSEFIRVANRLKGVDIRCKDAHKLIALCNKRLNPDLYSGGIFFYFDPPYDETSGYKSLSGGKSIYGKNEQRDLFELAKKIHENGNKFMMSNSYTDFLVDMWGSEKDFRLVERKVTYTVVGSSNKSKNRELIVANFDLEKTQSEVQRSLF